LDSKRRQVFVQYLPLYAEYLSKKARKQGTLPPVDEPQRLAFTAFAESILSTWRVHTAEEDAADGSGGSSESAEDSDDECERDNRQWINSVPPLYDYSYSADQAAKSMQLVVLKLAAHIQALEGSQVSATDAQHKILADLQAALISYGYEGVHTQGEDITRVCSVLEAFVAME
jgi:hypothetical protein